MIYDDLRNLALYSKVNDNIDVVYNFITKNDLEQISTGKHLILDDKCFVLSFNYDTKPADEALWERHQKYLDLHLVLSGRELISYKNFTEQGVKTSIPYDTVNDCELFNITGNSSSFTLTNKSFAIFFPEDIHRTGVHENAPLRVKKLVFKMLM